MPKPKKKGGKQGKKKHDKAKAAAAEIASSSSGDRGEGNGAAAAMVNGKNPVMPTVVPLTPVQLFQQAICYVDEFNPDADFDIERHSKLVGLLSQVNGNVVEEHTKLLQAALAANDNEAITAIIEADEFNCGYLSLNEVLKIPQSIGGRRAQIKLQVAILSKCNRLDTKTIETQVSMPQFSVNHFRSEAVIKAWLATIERCQVRHLLMQNKSAWFQMACDYQLPSLLHYCLQFDIVPDQNDIQLYGKCHSPLAILLMAGKVDVATAKSVLFQQWDDEYAIYPLQLLQLLAVAHRVEDSELITTIRMMLALLNTNDDLTADVMQLPTSELLLMLYCSEPEIKENTFDVTLLQQFMVDNASLTVLQYLAVMDADYHAAAVFQLLQQKITQLITKDHLPIALVFSRYRALILEMVVSELTDAVCDDSDEDIIFVEFVSVLAVLAGDTSLLDMLFLHIPVNMIATVTLPMSDDIVKSLLLPDYINPLQLALLKGRHAVAIKILGHLQANEVDVQVNEFHPYQQVMLSAILQHDDVDQARRLLLYFYQRCPQLYCFAKDFDSLLNLAYVGRETPDRVLLRIIAKMVMPLFGHSSLVFMSDNVDPDKLDDLALAYDALGETEENIALYSPLGINIRQQLQWYQWFNDADNAEDPQSHLHDILADYDETEGADNSAIIEQFMQRLFWLFHHNKQLLHDELSDMRRHDKPANAALDQPASFFMANVLSFLTVYRLKDILNVILTLLPELDISEDKKIEGFIRPLSVLCNQGERQAAERWIAHLRAHPKKAMHADLSEKQLSPVYLAMLFGIYFEPNEPIKEVQALSDEELRANSPVCLLQMIAYIDFLINQIQSTHSKFKSDIKKLKAVIGKTCQILNNDLLSHALAEKDGLMLFMAIKYQYQSSLPVQYRKQMVAIALTSPNVDLCNVLRLQPNDFMHHHKCVVNHVNVESDALSIIFMCFDHALLLRDRRLVQRYLELLSVICPLINVSSQQLDQLMRVIDSIKTILKVEQGSTMDMFIDKHLSQVLLGAALPLSSLRSIAHINLCKTAIRYAQLQLGVVDQKRVKTVFEQFKQSERTIHQQKHLPPVANETYWYLRDVAAMGIDEKRDYIACMPDRLSEDVDVLRLWQSKNYVAILFLLEQGRVDIDSLSLATVCLLLCDAFHFPAACSLIERRLLCLLHEVNYVVDSSDQLYLLIHFFAERKQETEISRMLAGSGKNIAHLDRKALVLLAKLCQHRLDEAVMVQYCRYLPDTTVDLSNFICSESGYSPLYYLSQLPAWQRQCQEQLLSLDNIPKQASVQSVMQLLVCALRLPASQSARGVVVDRRVVVVGACMSYLANKNINAITYIRLYMKPELLKYLCTDSLWFSEQIQLQDLQWLFVQSFLLKSEVLLTVVSDFMKKHDISFEVTQAIKQEDGMIFNLLDYVEDIVDGGGDDIHDVIPLWIKALSLINHLNAQQLHQCLVFYKKLLKSGFMVDYAGLLSLEYFDDQFVLSLIQYASSEKCFAAMLPLLDVFSNKFTSKISHVEQFINEKVMITMAHQFQSLSSVLKNLLFAKLASKSSQAFTAFVLQYANTTILNLQVERPEGYKHHKLLDLLAKSAMCHEDFVGHINHQKKKVVKESRKEIQTMLIKVSSIAVEDVQAIDAALSDLSAIKKRANAMHEQLCNHDVSLYDPDAFAELYALLNKLAANSESQEATLRLLQGAYEPLREVEKQQLAQAQAEAEAARQAKMQKIRSEIAKLKPQLTSMQQQNAKYSAALQEMGLFATKVNGFRDKMLEQTARLSAFAKRLDRCKAQLYQCKVTRQQADDLAFIDNHKNQLTQSLRERFKDRAIIACIPEVEFVYDQERNAYRLHFPGADAIVADGGESLFITSDVIDPTRRSAIHCHSGRFVLLHKQQQFNVVISRDSTAGLVKLMQGDTVIGDIFVGPLLQNHASKPATGAC